MYIGFRAGFRACMILNHILTSTGEVRDMSSKLFQAQPEQIDAAQA